MIVSQIPYLFLLSRPVRAGGGDIEMADLNSSTQRLRGAAGQRSSVGSR